MWYDVMTQYEGLGEFLTCCIETAQMRFVGFHQRKFCSRNFVHFLECFFWHCRHVLVDSVCGGINSLLRDVVGQRVPRHRLFVRKWPPRPTDDPAPLLGADGGRDSDSAARGRGSGRPRRLTGVTVGIDDYHSFWLLQAFH